MQVGVCGRGYWRGQRGGVQSDPGQTAFFTCVVQQRLNELRRFRQATDNRALQQSPRRIIAQGGFKFGLGQGIAAQGFAVCGPVKLAINSCKRRDRHDLIADPGVTDRQAKGCGFIVERPVGNHLRHDRLIKPDGLRQLERQRLTDLLFKRLDLLVQRAGIGAGQNRLVTHGADAADITAKVCRPKTDKARDHKAENPVEHVFSALTACHTLILPVLSAV